MRVCGPGGVGFHTLFLLALVSVFLHLAVLSMCVRVCVVVPLAPSLALLTYLLAIPLFPRGWWASLVRLFIVSPLSVAAPYLLRFCLFFSLVVYLEVVGAYGGINLGIYGCGLCFRACFLTSVAIRRFFLGAMLSPGRPPSQHTWFSHLCMCSGGYDM